MVKAITLWDRPIADATFTAENTIARPPAIRRIRPIRIRNIDLKTGLSLTKTSSLYCSDFKSVILYERKIRKNSKRMYPSIRLIVE
jgi:hypothetical protein